MRGWVIAIISPRDACLSTLAHGRPFILALRSPTYLPNPPPNLTLYLYRASFVSTGPPGESSRNCTVNSTNS